MVVEKTMRTLGSQTPAGRLDVSWGEERYLAEYPGMYYCHF